MPTTPQFVTEKGQLFSAVQRAGQRSHHYKANTSVEGRRSKVEGRRSKVEGRRSKVEGRRFSFRPSKHFRYFFSSRFSVGRSLTSAR